MDKKSSILQELEKVPAGWRIFDDKNNDKKSLPTVFQSEFQRLIHHSHDILCRHIIQYCSLAG